MNIIKNTQKNRRIWKNKAWHVWSLYVRRRDGRCVTCGARGFNEETGEFDNKGFQAGHFHHGVLDFDDMNINLQCKRCNHFLSGNLAKYAVYLVEKYGEKKFKDLGLRAKNALRGELMDIKDYQDLIKKYS